MTYNALNKRNRWIGSLMLIGLLVLCGCGSVETDDASNPTTEVAFFLAKAQRVTAYIENSYGTRVRTLINGEHRSSNTYRLRFSACDDDGRCLPNGVYFVIAETEHSVLVRQRLLLVR